MIIIALDTTRTNEYNISYWQTMQTVTRPSKELRAAFKRGECSNALSLNMKPIGIDKINRVM